uniref:Fibrinogen like 2 n=1 Tax=Sinocyclocheilus grahami TaxID=75366 RepID=A0A672S5U2_SINGR
MWLAVFYIWGSLLAFSVCHICSETSEDAASWVTLKPLGHCGDEENLCPYQLTLPPLSIQLPRPFRELEKMAKELQNLKDMVNQLRRDCQERKDRHSIESGGQKEHSEEKERRHQSPRHNISISIKETQSHSGEQVFRLLTSTLPQGDTSESEGTVKDGVKRLNHSVLESQEWNTDPRIVLNEGTTDQSSEMSREVKIFNPSLDERPEDISKVKLVVGVHSKLSIPVRNRPAQDCADYITKSRRNGVYRVMPQPKSSMLPVFCDMESSGGGWTLIQHRFDGSTSFNRTWDEYKNGFGKLIGEFWLGNDKIHLLTKAKNMSLRIEIEDFEGIREYAHYDHFYVANESQQYCLSISGYSGTAGNAMQFSKKYNHDQKLFTTPDRDNDQYPSGNCGAYYSSGWWFDACMSANLNGRYYQSKYKGVRNGIFWGTWHNITMEYYPTNDRQSFKTVKMMIRPKNYAI